MDRILDALGELLVASVRDESIERVAMMVRGEMKGETSEYVRGCLAGLDSRAIDSFVRVVPSLVDHVLHSLLAAVDESEDVDFLISDAGLVRASEESDGLAGELYGSRGWLERFSRLYGASDELDSPSRDNPVE